MTSKREKEIRKLLSHGDAMQRLPSPKGVALEIMRVAQLEDTTVDDIADLIEKDPALSARLIKMANSPVAGFSRQVTSAREATTVLGFSNVRSLALAASLIEDSSSCGGLDHEILWAESLGRAVLMRRLAARLQVVPPDEAFTYGLLSLIGRLALATVFPDLYEQVIANSDQTNRKAISDAERRLLQVEANELSALMLLDWGMPKLFAALLADESDAAGAALLRMLELASRLAECLVGDPSPREAEAATRLAAALDVSNDELEELFDEAAMEWAQSGGEFDVPTRTVEPLAKLLAAASA